MNKDIKIAYLIIAYTDEIELKSLVSRLVCSADVYIHINSSVDIQPFKKALENIEGKICFSEKRYPVVWGGYSILQATFGMLENALNYCDYDRIILLTGLDYPIKSDKYIRDFFMENAKVEFVCAGVATGEMYNHLYYYDCRDNRLLHRLFRTYTGILKRFKCKGRKDCIKINGQKSSLYGKAPKWALSGDCARYLLDFYKNNKKVNRYFQFMHAPDDFYVSTVLFNSPFKARINARHNLFKIMWLPEDKGAKVLTEEDYTELIESHQLYAKKFQSNASEKLQAMLQEENQ